MRKSLLTGIAIFGLFALAACSHEHAAVVMPAVAPSCQSAGLSEGSRCAECGELLLAQQSIPALPHTPAADAAVPATCQSAGLSEGSHCAECGEVLRAQTAADKLPHTPVPGPAIEASCASPGKTPGSRCMVCGEVLEAARTVPALPHTPESDAAVPATCQSAGLSEGSHCAVCGEVLRAQTTADKLPHTPVTIPEIAATCYAPGKTAESRCAECGEVLEAARTLPALAHTPTPIPAVPATCTATGLSEGSRCAVCRKLLTAQKTVAMTDHTPVSAPAVPAACDTVGLTAGTACAHCSLTLSGRTTVPMLGHTPQKDPAVPATCRTAGWTEGSHCAVCGEIQLARQSTPLASHTYGEDGRCTVCGAIKEADAFVMPQFAPLAYTVSEKETVIENDRFILRIDPNVYIPSTIEADIHAVLDANERITGLSYYPDDLAARMPYDRDRRIVITIRKGTDGKEVGSAYGGINGLTASGYDLLIGAGEAWVLNHELLHTLNARNGSFMCQALCEGFTTYFTQKIIERQWMPMNFDGYFNYQNITGDSPDGQDITPESAEALFVHGDTNGWFSYLYGFRFMHYLIEHYGMETYMALSVKLEPLQERGMFKNAEMIPHLKEHFGEDIFAKFGAWYVENRDLFENGGWGHEQHFEAFSRVLVFPQYAMRKFYERLCFTYTNRVILDFEDGLVYAADYIGDTLTGELSVRASTAGSAALSFYGRDGKLLETVRLSGQEKTYKVKGACRILVEGDGSSVLLEPIFEEIIH